MRWDLRKTVERLRGIITRGHVTRISKGNKHLLIHGQDWYETDVHDVPYIQHGGIFYWPKPDSQIEYIMLDPNADPSHRVAVSLSAKEMPDDAKEGVWIANPDGDGQIKIDDGEVVIDGDKLCLNIAGEELLQVLIDALSAVQPTNPPAVTAAIAKLTAMKC